MRQLTERWRRSLLLVTALVVVALAGAGCLPSTAQVESADREERTISVTGSGTVGGEPDEVLVRLGVETTAETASDALSQNSERMQDVIDALKDAGITGEDIQTQSVQLSPRYETPERELTGAQQRQLIGYVATNIVEARSEELAAVGQLLDTAVQAGGNRIVGIRFEVSNPTELLAQAREAAWEDAEQKARQLADLAGSDLGEVLSVNESTRIPRPVGLGGAVQREAAIPIEPGTENVEVDLQVTWALR